MNAARMGPATLAAALAAAAAPGSLGVLSALIEGSTIETYGLGVVFFVGALCIGLPVALLHAILIGVPAYLWLSERWPIRWWSAAAAGALIGALPLSLLFLGVAAVHVQSVTELTSLILSGLGFPLAFGLSGAIGGVIFWAFVRERGNEGEPA